MLFFFGALNIVTGHC